MKYFNRMLDDESGIAIPLVVVLMLIIMVLGFTGAYLVNSQLFFGQRYSAYDQTLYIAEAGVNRAIYLLNEYPEFGKNPDFIDYNDPDDNKLIEGSFDLEIIPATSENPIVTVISRGSNDREPQVSRTLQVQARKRSFTNYVYFSNNDGDSIWWTGTEKCYGPLHTNTTLNIQESPTFFNTVTYGVGLNKGSPYNPQFLLYAGYEPTQVEPLLMPSNNKALETVTLALFSDHHYSGRTSILLKGTTYDVLYWDWDEAEYTLVENKPLPPNGVIYVAGEEGTGFVAPNKFGHTMGNVFVSGVLSGRLTIAAENNIYITGRDPTELDFDLATITPGGGIRYQNTTINLNESTGETTIGGVGDDMLGLVANNFIYILCWGWFDSPGATGEEQRNHRPDVAAGNVEIYAAILALNQGFGYEPYHMNSQGNYSSPGWESMHRRGDPLGTGKVIIRGSLIQNTRKPVGVLTTPPRGYLKDYAHDPRMAFDSPPYFLEPENAGWEILSWREN